MPLRYLLDENLRGLLWKAILRHNAVGIDVIDAVRVGDHPDLPLGSADPEILLWAEAADRVLVTRDKRTIATHLAVPVDDDRVAVDRFARGRGHQAEGEIR